MLASTYRRRPLSTSDQPPPNVRADADADPVEVARRIVLNQLSRAPRTRAQLEQACTRRGVPESAASIVLDRFTELGLVDDEAFASAWVESRHHARGLAPRALRRELRFRGVADDTVDGALAAIDADAERDAAEALVRARLPSLSRYDRPTQLRRLQGLLVRRGYAPGLAWTVVRSALADAESGRGAWTDEAEEQV